MTFIIVLIAFIMERFLHWNHLRQWGWFWQYEKFLSQYTDNMSIALKLAVNLIPPIVIVGLIGYIIEDWFYGLFGLVFGVLVLLYSLGPGNLWVQVYECITESDNDKEKELAKNAFGVSYQNSKESFHRKLVDAIFIAANERIFAVIFWFIILGPLGALLYRLVEIFSARKDLNLDEKATDLKNLLDWLPVRVFAFMFALAGHFKDVFASLKKYIKGNLSENNKLLTKCGVAAIDSVSNEHIVENGEAENEALELIDRSFTIFMVILALAVLII